LADRGLTIVIRLSALLWLALVVVTGFVMFKVKYTVQELDDEFNRVRKQTFAEQQEIRVLNAEWSYLTQPERLTDLNRRFLALGPVQTKQLQHAIDEFPVRPLPIPEIPPPAAILAMPAVASAAATAPLGATPPITAPVAAPPPAATPVAATPALANVAPPPAQSPAPPVSPALPVTQAALKMPVGSAPAAKVQLAKASTTRAPRTLNDLFAEIEGGR
jgi:hypothetical protein